MEIFDLNGLGTEIKDGSTSYLSADVIGTHIKWRDAGLMIGPVNTFYEGIYPGIENKVEFETPTFILCETVSLSRFNNYGEILDFYAPKNVPGAKIWQAEGIRVSHPLVFDHELGAFGELINDENYPVSHMWVSVEQAPTIQALRGLTRYVNRSNQVQIVDPALTRITV